MNLNLIALQAGDQGMMQIIMIVALIVIFYFFMIRPQQKKQKEIRKFRESLSKGDKVITAGGIHGRITKVTDTDFSIEIARDVIIVVDRNSVYPAGTDSAQMQQNENLQK